MQFSFVRRLDELGRIVIPKEIRNKLNFNFGDLLELNISSESLVIKKITSVFNKDYINEIISLIDYFNNFEILITDTEKVIAKSQSCFININDYISSQLKELILDHKSQRFKNGLAITKDIYLDGEVFVKAIIKDSDTIGLLVLKSKNNNENINFFINIISNLLLK